jgi:hypothetical protein
MESEVYFDYWDQRCFKTKQIFTNFQK